MSHFTKKKIRFEFKPLLRKILVACQAGTRGVASFARSGGTKLKSGGGQRFSPKCEGFFWPKSQTFRPKAGDLRKKKKIFAEIRGFLLAEIANFNVFFPQTPTFSSQKNTVGGKKKKSGGGGKNKNRGGHSPLSPAGDAPGWNYNL